MIDPLDLDVAFFDHLLEAGIGHAQGYAKALGEFPLGSTGIPGDLFQQLKVFKVFAWFQEVVFHIWYKDGRDAANVLEMNDTIL